MKHIWTPLGERHLPDPENPLDMALLYQSEIESQTNPKVQYDIAREALALLAIHFDTDNPLFMQSLLGTKEALIESVDSDSSTAILANEVGLIGEINGLSYFGIAHNNFGLALNIEAEYLFSLGMPDEGDMIMRPARVPIRALEFVEYETSI